MESGKVTTKNLIAAAILSPEKFYKKTREKEQINQIREILESTNFYNLEIIEKIIDFENCEITIIFDKNFENQQNIIEKLMAQFLEIGFDSKIISEEKNDKIQIKL